MTENDRLSDLARRTTAAEPREDDLRPARGILIGFIIALPFWLGLLAMLLMTGVIQ